MVILIGQIVFLFENGSLPENANHSKLAKLHKKWQRNQNLICGLCLGKL